MESESGEAEEEKDNPKKRKVQDEVSHLSKEDNGKHDVEETSNSETTPEPASKKQKTQPKSPEAGLN
jgi:hypothetical protein